MRARQRSDTHDRDVDGHVIAGDDAPLRLTISTTPGPVVSRSSPKPWSRHRLLRRSPTVRPRRRSPTIPTPQTVTNTETATQTETSVATSVQTSVETDTQTVTVTPTRQFGPGIFGGHQGG